MDKSPRPTRFGHVLRRLLAGKTSAINARVAEVFERDGLIVVYSHTGSAVRVALTPAGRRVAEAAQKGVKVYDQNRILVFRG